jgi:hypothetical protein
MNEKPASRWHTQRGNVTEKSTRVHVYRTAAYHDQQQTKEHVDIGRFGSGDLPKRIMQGLGLVVDQNRNTGTLFHLNC